MLRTLSLAVTVKTSPDSIGKVQCLANTSLQELQALLNVNTFSFPLRERGGQLHWPSLAAREAKHVIEKQFVQENSDRVRHNCSPRSVLSVKLLFQTRHHCKVSGLNTDLLKREEEGPPWVSGGRSSRVWKSASVHFVPCAAGLKLNGYLWPTGQHITNPARTLPGLPVTFSGIRALASTP